MEELVADEVITGALGDTRLNGFWKRSGSSGIQFRKQVHPWEREQYLTFY